MATDDGLASSLLAVPAGTGQMPRTLKSHSSRERSPRGDANQPAAPFSAATGEVATFGVGNFVLLRELETPRAFLNGRVGTVESFDAADNRYTVRVAGESLRVRASNLAASLFPPT